MMISFFLSLPFLSGVFSYFFCLWSSASPSISSSMCLTKAGKRVNPSVSSTSKRSVPGLTFLSLSPHARCVSSKVACTDRWRLFLFQAVLTTEDKHRLLRTSRRETGEQHAEGVVPLSFSFTWTVSNREQSACHVHPHMPVWLCVLRTCVNMLDV